MADALPRVVLLARPGKAADNLVDALRQAGAELVAVADPTGLDTAALLSHRPQAVLVALEPGIESAVDALDDVLAAPELTVIFDEADIAAQRAGWDAARWVRHLSAKLHRHHDVLPPGTEAETEILPTPGLLPKPEAAYANRLDIAAFAREAEGRAESVPVGELGVDRSAGFALPPLVLPAELAGSAVASVPDVSTPADTSPPSSPALAMDDDAFFLETLAAESADVGRPESSPGIDSSDAPAALVPDARDLSDTDLDVQLDPVVSSRPAIIDDEEIGFADELDLDALDADELRAFQRAMAAADGDTTRAAGTRADDEDTLAFDPAMLEDLGFDPALLTPIQPDLPDAPSDDPLPFSFEAPEPVRASPPAEPPSGPVSTPPPLPPATPAPAAGVPDFSSLRLADDDMAPPPAASPPSRPHRDLSDLEQRIAGLSLVDIEPKEVPAHAAVGVLSEPLRPYEEGVKQAPAIEASAATAADASYDDSDDGSAASLAYVPARDDLRMILVEAGLGGPDPVRQLLAGLPAGFRVPLVIRLQLQGGRYDRLVAQMERAASLPVVLAQPDQPLLPGRIHFLPDGVGLRRDATELRFDVAFAGSENVYETVGALDDSALVFLSGSDPALVDRAIALAATGAFVVAQSPEDCYDGVACARLRACGIPAAAAPELAMRLAQRWPN